MKYCIFNKNNGENNDENNLKLKEENLNLTQDTKLIETCNKGEYHEIKAIKN